MGSDPFERVGWRRYGKPWRRWKPRRRRLPNRPRPKVVITRGCPTTRPSVTSPIPSRASSPHLEERTSCKRTTVRRWWTALTRCSWPRANATARSDGAIRLRSRGLVVSVPMEGLRIGEQLRWLTKMLVADLHRPQPAQTVPLWGQSAQEGTGRWASSTHQELCRGSEHGAIRKAIWGPAGATGKISCRDPLAEQFAASIRFYQQLGPPCRSGWWPQALTHLPWWDEMAAARGIFLL